MHYAFGSFTYDAKRGKLQCYGADIPLKPKTGALLLYFLQHPHRVITKAELLDTLWRDEDVVEANLAQHVFLLRQAFATYSPGETFIVTTARQGYCFVAPVQTVTQQPPARGTSWKPYVEGRFFTEHRTEASLRRAIDAYERAVAIDSSHAGAHAGIAQAHVLAAQHLFIEPGAAFTRAREAARRALELDPENVEAHIALGDVHLFHDWDFVAAYEAFERATWLDPAHAAGRLHKAWFLGVVGNYEAAVSEIESVLGRDPSSLSAMATLAAVAIFHADFAAAIEMSETVLSLDPSYAPVIYHLISGLAFSGRYHDALQVYDAVHVQPYRQQSLAVAAYAAARAGLQPRADALVAQIEDVTRWPYIAAFNRALPRAGANDLESAREILGDGILAHDPWSIFILRHPVFEDLPGIEDLRHEIGPYDR